MPVHPVLGGCCVVDPVRILPAHFTELHAEHSATTFVCLTKTLKCSPCGAETSSHRWSLLHDNRQNQVPVRSMATQFTQFTATCRLLSAT